MTEITLRLPPDSIDALAEAAHDAWLAEKSRRGVTSWPDHTGVEQMVPYATLDSTVQEFDRVVVRAIMRQLGRYVTKVSAVTDPNTLPTD